MGFRLLKGFLLFGLLLFLSGCQPGTLSPSAQNSGVLKLEELSYTDIDALDRGKTVFVLTFGNLEEHGPHLPVGSDYFQALAVRDGGGGEAAPIAPGLHLRTVSRGAAGRGRLQRPGPAVRPRGRVRRPVQHAAGCGRGPRRRHRRQGFQNIFLIHNHGSPMHNVAFT